eukprot:COSAG02_NODE_30758_length_546_cov_0.536913_1_plen_20_part_01
MGRRGDRRRRSVAPSGNRGK